MLLALKTAEYIMELRGHCKDSSDPLLLVETLFLFAFSPQSFTWQRPPWVYFLLMFAFTKLCEVKPAESSVISVEKEKMLSGSHLCLSPGAWVNTYLSSSILTLETSEPEKRAWCHGRPEHKWMFPWLLFISVFRFATSATLPTRDLWDLINFTHILNEHYFKEIKIRKNFPPESQYLKWQSSTRGISVHTWRI